MLQQFISCNKDLFIEDTGEIVAGSWFKSKFHTENKFFHFVEVGHVLPDGTLVCFSTGQLYPKDDIICKVKKDYYRWFTERVSKAVAKLKELEESCQPGLPADTPGNRAQVQRLRYIVDMYLMVPKK